MHARQLGNGIGLARVDLTTGVSAEVTDEEIEGAS